MSCKPGSPILVLSAIPNVRINVPASLHVSNLWGKGYFDFMSFSIKFFDLK